MLLLLLIIIYLILLIPKEEPVLEQQHLLGLGETEDVANACIYLLSDASKWVTGIDLCVDGGYTAG
ncbi:SDR family oxidoreductase [Bacteroides salyersiae]|nr:SDR family oxidoreductase [Bacteroides salyersiae]